MSKKDLERVKDMHEWEMKKKTQSYEMEINRLNKLLEMNSNLNKNISELNKNNRNQFLVQEKEKQIQHEKRKLYDLQSHLKERERAL